MLSLCQSVPLCFIWFFLMMPKTAKENPICSTWESYANQAVLLGLDSLVPSHTNLPGYSDHFLSLTATETYALEGSSYLLCLDWGLLTYMLEEWGSQDIFWMTEPLLMQLLQDFSALLITSLSWAWGSNWVGSIDSKVKYLWSERDSTASKEIQAIFSITRQEKMGFAVEMTWKGGHNGVGQEDTDRAQRS